MKKIYISMMFVAIVVYACQRLDIQLPALVNNYLNDFLCIPIILSISNFVVRKIKKDKSYKLSVYIIFFIVLYYSVYFEFYLPKVQHRYTADVIDVVLYCAGGIVYWLIENSSVNSKK